MKREIFASTTKKSFLIATIFWPLLFSVLGIFFLRPSANSTGQHEEQSTVVQVVNADPSITEPLLTSENIRYVYSASSLVEAQSEFLSSNHFALLYIPDGSLKEEGRIQLFARQNDLDKALLGRVEMDLMRALLVNRMKSKPTYDSTLLANVPDVQLSIINLYQNSEAGRQLRVREFLSLYFAISTFFLLLFWTREIMSRVLEEKSNRIIELVMTSVRSFDLILGKILGFITVEASRIAIGILILVLLLPFYEIPTADPTGEALTTASSHSFFDGISTLEGVTMIMLYLFFLTCGFLLYSSIFAAIGAAVDAENEAVPFQIPVWALLLFSLVVVTSFHQPHNTVAVWASIFPFTSPIVMLMRIPFGVAWWELALSMILLFSTFLLVVFAAGKIYRLGVLLHGAKADFKTVAKWIFR